MVLKPPKLYAPKLRESSVEQKVSRWARDNGWLSYKFTSPGHRSVPDRLFVSPAGRVLFIEFKRPGGKPTEMQSNEIQKLRGHLVEVEVFDNADDAIRWLKEAIWR